MVGHLTSLALAMLIAFRLCLLTVVLEGTEIISLGLISHGYLSSLLWISLLLVIIYLAQNILLLSHSCFPFVQAYQTYQWMSFESMRQDHCV